MAKEDDALLSMENALAGEIKEKQKQLEHLKVEIEEGLAHLQSLKNLRAWRQGKPLASYQPQPLTLAQPETGGMHQRGWMKEQIIYWIRAVAPQKFRGRDAAIWLRKKLEQQGEELKPYQYNNVFPLLNELASKGEMIRKVGSQYEKINLSARIALVPIREERK